MIKKLLIVLITILAVQVHAQDRTASPYSFYGIGSLKFKGTVENRSMGGISMFTDSIHVNLQNPASTVSPNLKMFQDEGRPIKLALGGTYSSVSLKGDGSSDNASTTTFDYFAMTIPMGKFGVTFGMLPYTAVGYKLESIQDDILTNRFRGEGGLNKVFFDLGYQITNELSFGVDMAYNFGNIQNSAIEFVYGEDGELVQYQSREDNRSDLSGLSVNLGLSYTKLLNRKLQLKAGATYSPKSDIRSKNTRSFSTIIINEFSGQEFVVNTIDADLVADGLNETDLTLPSSFSLGFGLGRPKQWFVGAEYTRQYTSQFGNPVFDIDNSNFIDGSVMSLGGFLIPDYDSFGSYWKRVTYRAGVRFENTGLEINNEKIDEFGISFGAGLPIGGLFSNANIGLEFGNRGTTNENLIKENFFNFQIGLSLNDRWFQKRKYD